MTVTSGSVVLSKDEKNLIGISIGGGAPLCPCLYIVQIFDNTPASKDGTLQSGDELVGVNGQSVKGKTKVEVAKMIQSAKFKTIILTYQELNQALKHSRMLKAYFDLLQTYKSVGDIFAAIGVREPQARASEAFTKFGQYHRLLERDGIKMLKALKPILSDMGTYLNKAIPDTKLTIRKYADTKFEYLSYCLKDNPEEEEDLEFGKEIHEYHDIAELDNKEAKLINRRQNKDNDDTESSEQLLPDFDNVALTYDKVEKSENNDKTDNVDNLTLLTELGLADTNVQDDFGDFQNGLLDEFLPKASGDDKNDIFDKLLNDFSLLNK
ncbi:hypothetical protein HF086_011959 [Spodoptera exigua]|uniref:PRKCA-binding protein n=1 Tax=Spodoptera exigua TaxID=7107 RepID=A0A922M6T7_SPOEX|nr:hypothetical protein HF086_011959 [Spodoptera exigua]